MNISYYNLLTSIAIVIRSRHYCILVSFNVALKVAMHINYVLTNSLAHNAIWYKKRGIPVDTKKQAKSNLRQTELSDTAKFRPIFHTAETLCADLDIKHIPLHSVIDRPKLCCAALLKVHPSLPPFAWVLMHQTLGTKVIRVLIFCNIGHR